MRKKEDKVKVSQYEKMTKTPVQRLILTLSVPSIISMLITNIYNLADTAFVGRLGTSASGAVGVVFGFMAVIQAFGFMFGQGAGSILARALGGQDKENATKHASTGFFMSFICGLLITAVGFIWLDDIAPYARTYITYILIAAPMMISSFVLNNILRYEGRASLGMIGLMTGALLNIAGDPVLMFGCGMGIAGAGLSTAISQLISWGILLSMFITGRTQTVINIKMVAWKEPMTILNIMSTGFPSLLRQGLNSFTTMLLNLECAVYGDAAVAAMSIVSRIIFFTFSIVIGVGQGFQPVSAFNYGAGNYDRLKKAYKFTFLMSEAVIFSVTAILILLSGDLIRIFRDDPDVILTGTRALRLQALSQLLLPVCSTTEMLFQSTGHRLGATLISALRSGVLFIPSIILLAHLRGLNGIQEAQPLAILLSVPITVPFAVHFFRSLKNPGE